MPNLFSGINMALRAMLAQQQVIEIIEQNVANAGTPGYHRQEAMLKATPAYPALALYGGNLPGQFGSGVTVDQIRRFTTDFYDGRYRLELAESSRWELQRDVLKQVEATLAETSSDGLVSKLDAFWSGWQALSADPSNMTLRSDLKVRAEALTEAFNWRAQSLMKIRQDQDLSLRQGVEEVNTLASQLARLNAEISNISAANLQPNDLLDERDRILDRLAELTGATASIADSGEALVSIGGHALVVGATAFRLTTVPDAADSNLVDITWEADSMPLNMDRGELYGMLRARDDTILTQIDGLNQLAFELVNQVNPIHRTGYGLDNATNLDFFQPFATTNYALEIHLSTDIDDPASIAAAAGPDSPGDGSIAIALADLRDQAVMSGNTMSLNEYYMRQIGELGLELRSATKKTADRQVVVDSLATMKESQSGVSLDEEAARLVQAQRTYQAAARLLTAIDEMMDKVINGMGVVGR
jgi:flagellar hook-associated protein 1 FlgK